MIAGSRRSALYHPAMAGPEPREPPDPRVPAPPATDPETARWRALLTGEAPSLRDVRRFSKHVPSAPRWKVGTLSVVSTGPHQEAVA